MRLLVINPNTSPGVTQHIRAAADAIALPEDAFTTLCPAFGPELIVTEQDARDATRAVVDTVSRYQAPYDGIVLASFGNTGVDEVRELRPDVPVIGIARAAFLTAQAIGGPLGIVTFGAALVPGLRAKVEEAGLGETLLDIAYLQDKDFGDPGSVQSRYCASLAELCAQMYQRGAACIVLGGGPLAGLAPQLSAGCPVPIIDGTQAAINLMRTVVVPSAKRDMALENISEQS